MVSNCAVEREQAHSLIDELPDAKVAMARSLLEGLLEPVSYTMENAPYEDEEISPEMSARLDRARASLARGEIISHEEILREFGL